MEQRDLIQHHKGSRELLKARDPKMRQPRGEGHVQEEACKVTGDEGQDGLRPCKFGKAGKQRTSGRRGKGGQ